MGRRCRGAYDGSVPLVDSRHVGAVGGASQRVGCERSGGGTWAEIGGLAIRGSESPVASLVPTTPIIAPFLSLGVVAIASVAILTGRGRGRWPTLLMLMLLASLVLVGLFDILQINRYNGAVGLAAEVRAGRGLMVSIVSAAGGAVLVGFGLVFPGLDASSRT